METISQDAPPVATMNTLVESYQFNEFEGFEESFIGMDLELRQLDRGSFKGSLKSFRSPLFALTECTLNRQIEQKGSPQAGMWTFGIPCRDEFKVRWHGKNESSDKLLLFRPDEEVDCISDSDFHAIAITIPQSHLTKIAEQRGLSHIDELVTSDNTISLSKSGSRHLRQSARALIRSIETQSKIRNAPPCANDMDTDFLEDLFEVASYANNHSARPMAKIRRQALRKALEVIHDSENPDIRVYDIERLCGATGRTLRYAFLEEFGVSPKQYLLAYRLNKIRRRLRKKSPHSGLIADIANEQGFWHMGEFAAHYSKMFCELPSETLSKH